MGVNIDQAHLDVGNAVRIRGGFGFRQQGGAFLVGGQHDIDQRLVGSWRFLGNLADAGIARNRHAAGFRRKIAGDDPEQRRFACAVFADKTGLRARRKRHVGLINEKTPGNAG